MSPAEAVASTYMNRSAIEASEKCGCYRCLAVFSPREITLWCDSVDPEDEDPGALRTDIDKFKGMTAVCPICEDDSLIASSCDVPLTEEFLRSVYDYWCRR